MELHVQMISVCCKNKVQWILELSFTVFQCPTKPEKYE